MNSESNIADPPQTTGQRPRNGLTLPALKSLGELADAQPVIIVDSREQFPLIFTRLRSVRGTLSEGDYGIAGVTDFAIERKGSLDELAGNCVEGNRDRFERELHRLRPYRFRRLLIVGATCDDDILNHPYRSAINPRCVLGSLYTWQARFDIPFVLTPSPASAVRLIELFAHYQQGSCPVRERFTPVVLAKREGTNPNSQRHRCAAVVRESLFTQHKN